MTRLVEQIIFIPLHQDVLILFSQPVFEIFCGFLNFFEGVKKYTLHRIIIQSTYAEV